MTFRVWIAFLAGVLVGGVVLEVVRRLSGKTAGPETKLQTPRVEKEKVRNWKDLN